MMRSLDQPNFKVNGSIDSPLDINLDIMGFSKVYNIVGGELASIEYFKDRDIETKVYSNLVAKINNTYQRDALGIVQSRISVAEFYFEDDTIGSTKTWIKDYPYHEAIAEGIIRRNNVIAAAKTVLLKELKTLYGEPTNQSYAFDLLTSVKTELEYFKEGYTQPLRDAINASVKAYLTPAVKALVIIELTY